MENEEAYKEILNAIIASKVVGVGKLAIKAVKDVGGVIVDSDGNVLQFTAEPVDVIWKITQRYEEISGPISTSLIKSVMVGFWYKYPNLKLPEELSEKLSQK